jgi:hypothetical protein
VTDRRQDFSPLSRRFLNHENDAKFRVKERAQLPYNQHGILFYYNTSLPLQHYFFFSASSWSRDTLLSLLPPLLSLYYPA